MAMRLMVPLVQAAFLPVLELRTPIRAQGVLPIITCELKEEVAKARGEAAEGCQADAVLDLEQGWAGDGLSVHVENGC